MVRPCSLLLVFLTCSPLLINRLIEASVHSYVNTLTWDLVFDVGGGDGEPSRGALTLDYTVDKEDENAATNGEVFYGRLTFTHGDRIGGGWIGLGFAASTDNPKMKGSKAVIGLPAAIEAPKLWNLGDYSVEMVTPLTNRLILPRVSQNDTHTELEYAITAQDLGGVAQIPTTLLWAVGESNVLAHHGNRQVVDLAAEMPHGHGHSHQGEQSYIGGWRLHGWVAFIAWGVFVPLAITASLLREVFPASLPERFKWLAVHMTFNVSAIGFTFLAVIIAISLTARNGDPHFSGNHERMGLAMALVGSLQLAGGFWRPSRDAALTRSLWEIGHRGIALFLVLASLFQILSGLERFHDRFQKGEHRQRSFWIYVGTVFSVVAALRLSLWLRSRHGRKEMDTGAGAASSSSSAAGAPTQELSSMPSAAQTDTADAEVPSSSGGDPETVPSLT